MAYFRVTCFPTNREIGNEINQWYYESIESDS